MYAMIRTTLAAAALSVMASLGTAATLNLQATSPLLSAPDITVDYLDLGGGAAGLTGFADITSASGITLDAGAILFFDVSFQLATPYDPVFGTVDVSDASGAVIEGDFVGFGFTDTTLELLFDVFGGRFDAEFGTQVLVAFTLAPGTGTVLLSGLSDGDVLPGRATIGGNPSVIPLPAGLPLLATGFAGLWGLRRRETAWAKANCGLQQPQTHAGMGHPASGLADRTFVNGRLAADGDRRVGWPDR